MRVLCTGAGGFISHHLVKRLKRDGHWVRGVDLKYPEFEPSPADEFIIRDLREPLNAFYSCQGIDWVFNLAALMGGVGFISFNHALIAAGNSRINLNMLDAAHRCYVSRYLFSSSACIYPTYRQTLPDSRPLKESDAMPAEPENGYGWEKLYAEKLCEFYRDDYGLDTRIVRFHNIYGPLGTFDGGQEKSIAALCRKVALAKEGDPLEIWGDGQQSRSYTYIDDCVEGILRLMASDRQTPLNLGRDEPVSIDALADLIMQTAGKWLVKHHLPDQPVGVRGRNCDTTEMQRVLGWTPPTPLAQGLEPTYEWIASTVNKAAVSA